MVELSRYRWILYQYTVIAVTDKSYQPERPYSTIVADLSEPISYAQTLKVPFKVASPTEMGRRLHIPVATIRGGRVTSRGLTLQHNATSWDNGCQKPPLLTPLLTPVAPRRARDRVPSILALGPFLPVLDLTQLENGLPFHIPVITKPQVTVQKWHPFISVLLAARCR